MRDLSFNPLFGFWPTLVASLGLLLVFSLGLGLFLCRRATSDATALDWTRRGLIVLLLLAAATGPSLVSPTQTQAVNDTDVFFAVDVTGSMAVTDAQNGSARNVSRLAAAKQAVNTITDLYPGASFAAISFGAAASLDLPLTPDQQAITAWADHLSVEPTADSGGSSPDAPLDTLILAMRQDRTSHPDNHIVLYYLSDGEKTSPAQQRTFSTLRDFVDGGAVIGTGSTQGGKIPVVTAFTPSPVGLSATQQQAAAERTEPNRWIIDHTTGQAAISKLDTDNLKTIADQAAISYLHLDAKTTAQSLTAQLSAHYSLRATRSRKQVASVVWPLGIALFALILWEFGSALSKQRRYL